ncbi:hydrolase [Anaerovorax odorimutans]|uniref:Hydrolase n=1 Tax=Anaerovorax odorimutans TaxID=109327 RepID=A0ABT1RNI9_9FIRM|nr:hydrolase [Anaerovorax odorimutans]MCQ4636757.1 hydrolase [Anaerovorax odorimutans]
MSLIKREDALLAAIDFQEKLMPAMADPKTLEATAVKLAKGIRALDIPILVTQQYTKGLGATIQPIAEALGDFEPIDKTSFSAMGEPAFAEALDATGKKTVILMGIEAHICVQQTAIDLIDRGYGVYVIQDCIASRKESDNLCGQQRMAAAGAVITTYESVLYELLRGAKADGFKAVSAIVK